METGRENQSQDLERGNDFSMPETLGNFYMIDTQDKIKGASTTLKALKASSSQLKLEMMATMGH